MLFRARTGVAGLLAVCLLATYVPVAFAQANDGGAQIGTVPSHPRVTVEMSVAFVARGSGVEGRGRTNLPDGTELSISMTGEYPRCFPRCGFGYRATVRSGAFAFDLGTHAAGTYMIEIVTPGMQPSPVASILGKDGEYMRGRLVVDFNALGHFTDAFTGTLSDKPRAPPAMLPSFGYFVDYGYILTVLPPTQ